MSDPTPTNNARSDSVSSSGSPLPSPSTGRRNSAGLFANLAAQKRGDDPVSVARRQSMHDARPTAGFIGKLWNDFVRGSPK